MVKPPQGGKKWIWMLAGLLVVAGALALWLRPQAAPKPVVTATLHTAKVVVGTFERSIRLTGTTVAGKFFNIAAPLLRGPDSGRALTLVTIAKSGTWAKKGGTVAQIDTTAAKDHIDDVKAIVTQAESDIRKKKADQAIEEETLRQNIRETKAKLDKAKLDYGAAEIRTAIDQEVLKLTVEQYEAEYAEVMKDFETALASNKSELRLLDITLIRHNRHLDRHVTDLEKFTIRTPMDGLVVMLSIYRGGDMGQIQEGDQVAPNQTFMKIVDPMSIQMDANVNQVESEWIRVGQPATVHFDAFPNIHLKGKVYSIGALAVSGWRSNNYIRNIPVKVLFLEQHQQIIPDLSAGADVVVERKEDALLVPLAAVQSEGDKSFVHVKGATGLTRREVQLGSRNNTTAVVLAGLTAGQDVVVGGVPAAPAKP